MVSKESENAVSKSTSYQMLGLTDTQRHAIDTLYEAFNIGNPDLLDEVLAEDWRDTPMSPGQQPGRDGMKPMVKAFLAAITDLRFTPQEVVGSKDKAAVRLVLSGRHVGEWMGVPATGRTFEIAMHEMHHFDGDRITHTWHVEDWSGWREQVGAAGAS